ncbi:hypothetical protein P0D88_06055 [Paraburkholderia sp. RL18-103-BIB-C]|uniref:hypothetical protein n=1 Tax=Paraburkholderia sp. RL18-103-BIB-C TaxID=3031637 RepID=UPI0038BA667A
MTKDQTPPERIAAARQLYAVLKEYLDRPTWTPLDGTLIVSGIHPPPDCAEIPNGGVGLDGRIFSSGGNERFSNARRIWQKWLWRCEDDQENGKVTPIALRPDKFLIWCDDMDVETDWLRLYRSLIGYESSTDRGDVIPLAIVEYAAQTAKAIDVLTAKLVADELLPDAGAGNRKPASRSPMPLPESRERLSTEEFAAVLAVEPQSVRKRYSETGSYHGVRPTKLPNRRLLWPVDEVKRLLNGDTVGDAMHLRSSQAEVAKSGNQLATKSERDASREKGLLTEDIVRLFSRKGSWGDLSDTFSNPPSGLKKRAQGASAKGKYSYWRPIDVATWLYEHRPSDYPLTVLTAIFALEGLEQWAPLWPAQAKNLARRRY